MKVIGEQLLEERVQNNLDVKIIFNDKGIIFGDPRYEHCTMGCEGINYKQEYKGDSLAGIIVRDRIEIRNDPRFSEQRIKNIFEEIAKNESLSILKDYQILYKGKDLGRF